MNGAAATVPIANPMIAQLNGSQLVDFARAADVSDELGA
jgi:hypothetical protein